MARRSRVTDSGLAANLILDHRWVELQSEIKIPKNIGEMTFWVFVNVVSLKYFGMIHTNLGEMCFIPMNVHNELFNGVRQL